LLCCALLLGGALTLRDSAVAQEETEQPTVDLRLLDQPVWHDPATDPLGLRLRIVNRGFVAIEGFLLTIAAHPVVSTRSALHESFEGNAGAIVSAIPKTYPKKIAPGQSFDIELEDPVSSLSSLGSIVENGVYPLTLTLLDDSGVIQHDALTTPLILYPEDPEVPLLLSLVVPLNDLPSEGPDGLFRDPLDRSRIPLEEAVAPSGWLTGLVQALEAQAGELPPLERTVRVPPRRKGGKTRRRRVRIPQEGLHLGLAPTPRFIQELADMADGYRRASGQEEGEDEQVTAESERAEAARALLAELSGLVREDGIQSLLVPYSFPDIPALLRNTPERLEAELDVGSEVLGETLDIDVSRDWLFPPAGRIAAQSLEEIRFADADTARFTLFHPDAFGDDELVVQEGCPEAFASFTCPVSVRTTQGPTVGLVGDRGLQERFAALMEGTDERLELQNFFAETAAIRQELPSIEDRVVQVTMPSLWHPSPLLSKRLLGGLRGAPWLQTVTPAEGVDVAKPEPRSEAFIQAFSALDKEPPTDLFEKISDTEAFLDDFRRMQPPEQLVERLRRNTLVAQSRLWWSNPDLLETADAYLEGTLDQAEAEIAKISVGGPSEINLTSREGEIPLVVSNGTGFPTTVSVSVTSPQPDLVLKPGSVPPQQIAADDTYQFTIEANARSSGIFPIEVVVQTSDGSLDLAYKKITVRSTEFNRIAVGLTLGALAFLVLFYLLRVARRRRTGSAA
jgi:hypothetical protein